MDSTVAVEPERAQTARRFSNAASWQTSGYSPFGFGLRRLPADTTALPIPVQREPAPWLGPDAAYELLLQPADSLAAEFFIIPARAAVPMWIDRLRERSPEELRHSAGGRVITLVRMYGPPEHQPTAFRALRPQRIDLREAAEPLLEIHLDGGTTGRHADLRPALPLIIVR